jgi:RNA polymerase sigma-70 factor (ECF subfamily)
MEDKELAQKLLKGDKKALRRFYKLHYLRLLAYVRVRVRMDEDAEEIVHDSFLGFLDSLPLFGFRSSLWTFLVSIARHEIADYYRKLYAKKAIRYVPFVDQVYDKPLYSSEETRELFEMALEKLLPQEKEIILWKYEEGFSVKEIADKLDLGVKAAESKLYRARKAFMVAYEEVSGD